MRPSSPNPSVSLSVQRRSLRLARRTWLDEILAQARAGTLPGMVRTGATFAMAAQEWLRFIEFDRQRKRSTVRGYRSQQVSRGGEGGKARRSGPSRSCRTGGVGCGSVVAHGLEVVRGREVRDVRSELPALHVRGAEVKARPDARFDELVERLIEAAE
jgi:hypothetical protein